MFWLRHEMITRNPLLSMMFKRDNDKVNQDGVCYLMNDLEDIHSEFDNRFNNPWLPANEDLPTLKKNCAGRSNLEINIAMVYGAYFNYIFHLVIGRKWDRYLSHKMYVKDHDAWIERML